MKRSSRRINSIHDAPCLPGFAPPQACAEARTPPDATGWWVKTSTEQHLDSSGFPAGFKHELYHGRRRIYSAGGFDGGRTLRAQAAFFNSQLPGPDTKRPVEAPPQGNTIIGQSSP